MKKIDEEGLKLCALQAEVFAASLTVTQCSSLIFIRRFMNSEVAARMDRRGFLLGASDTRRSGTAEKSCIGWDTCTDTGHIPTKKAASRCINK